jgi:hypothetical protein
MKPKKPRHLRWLCGEAWIPKKDDYWNGHPFCVISCESLTPKEAKKLAAWLLQFANWAATETKSARK